MKNTRFLVVSVIWALHLAAAAPSGPGLTAAGGRGRRRTQWDCRDDLEYLHDNICCLNCPAGTYVKSPCTSMEQRGICEECDFGTYTEHANGLRHCLKCTTCRSDQVVTKMCTSTEDRECECKPGLFCAPDQACEVCKKCTRCKEDELKVGNCTSTSNTMCKKLLPHPRTHSVVLAVISPFALIMAAAVIIAAVCCKRRKRSTTGPDSDPDETLRVIADDVANHTLEERQNSQNKTVDDSQLRLLPRQVQRVVRAKASVSEDEDTGLGESLPASTSNSQSSLSGQPSAPLPTSTSRPSPVSRRQQSTTECDLLPRLVPLNGDESLKKCFDYFEEMDVDYHKRFFRTIGLHDNVIKSRDPLSHEDRIHDLLNVWMEKVGKEASLNDLLRALLALNQRLTAENIMDKAVANGHYEREREREADS